MSVGERNSQRFPNEIWARMSRASGSVDFSPHELALREHHLQAEFEVLGFARRLSRGLKSTLR